MKTFILIFVAMLIAGANAHAQRSVDTCEENIACVVKGIKGKGTCSRRENETAEPQKLTFKIGVVAKLRAGEQLQCDGEALLVIQFCGSRKEKEIKRRDPPKWYTVPNVSSPHRGEDPFSTPGRRAESRTPVGTDFFMPQNSATRTDLIVPAAANENSLDIASSMPHESIGAVARAESRIELLREANADTAGTAGGSRQQRRDRHRRLIEQESEKVIRRQKASRGRSQGREFHDRRACQ